MDALHLDIGQFQARRRADAEMAAQRVALMVTTGLDIDEVRDSTGLKRKRLSDRLRRIMERERMKGALQPWSYDLDRHIALSRLHAELASTSDA